MKEDFLHEDDMFTDNDARQLKTSFNWLLILLIAGFAVSLFHLVMRLIFNNKFYMHATPADYEKVNMIYTVFAAIFILMNVGLYITAAIKINQTIGRVFVVIIGFFHIVSYLFYQFLN